MGMGPGASASGVAIGTSTQWGDTDLEFIVFQSCKVVPSPIDRSDWYQRWVGANDTFQGLHHATGYRTNSYSGNGISDNYGGRIRNNQRVRQAWFCAVNDERSWGTAPTTRATPRASTTPAAPTTATTTSWTIPRPVTPTSPSSTSTDPDRPRHTTNPPFTSPPLEPHSHPTKP
jgi:hypothetical protein